MARNFEITNIAKGKYVIEAHITANGFGCYIELCTFDTGMTYRELHKQWKMEIEEIRAIFEKYNFEYVATRETAKMIIEELEALILMKRMVTA